MAITLKRQLDDSEKQTILKRHGRICFATGHKIPDGDSLHFDHIRAFALDGESELDNIAPMCEPHNKAKGMLPLQDFRIKLRLDAFFNEGDRLTLRHLLDHLKRSGDIQSYGSRFLFKPKAQRSLSNTTPSQEISSFKNVQEQDGTTSTATCPFRF